MIACGVQGDNSNGITSGKPSGSKWIDVSVGDAHVCAVQTTDPATSGFVYCWGLGTSGQTAWNSTLFNYRSVSAGAAHTCATTLSNLVVCWGSNS